MTQMKYVESPAAVIAVDCDECNIDEVTNAVASCENCSRHLCGKHAKSHTKMKISSNHVVVALERQERAIVSNIAETDDDDDDTSDKSSSSWEDDDDESPNVPRRQNLSAKVPHVQKVSHVQKKPQLPSPKKKLLVPLRTSLNKQLVPTTLVPLKLGGIKNPLFQ